MGLFFNFEKEGPGIDKNAPKKKGIFLYFELLWRKLWQIVKTNLLYFAVSLPVMFIYNFIFINITSKLLGNIGGNLAFRVSLILTILLTILWGSGPVSCGYTYILRNFARDEHVWIVSDFFEKIKENFKLGIVMLIMDIAVLFFGVNALNIYIVMIGSGIAFAKIALALFIGVLFAYTFMHFYVYELAVTFQNTAFKTIRNAFVFAFANLPANLLLTIFVLVCTALLFNVLTEFTIILISLLIFITLFRFPIDFYTSRNIKKRFIRDEDDEESVE